LRTKDSVVSVAVKLYNYCC